MPSGLLLVPPLNIRGSTDCFAIGDLGRFQRDIHAIPALQSADRDFDMLLPGSGNQKFFRLRIAIEAQ